MGKEIKIAYDDEGDILDISIGDPEKAISKEVEDDFFLRVNPVSGEVVVFLSSISENGLKMQKTLRPFLSKLSLLSLKSGLLHPQ